MQSKQIGPYALLEEIGRGAMGEVYLAEDTVLKRKVVLKTLPSHDQLREGARQRFLREAQSAAALNHPNIVTVFAFLQEGESNYIAMEYVEGESLRAVVQEAPLAVPRIVDIVSQICDGIHCAHQQGIVHRDLKPENIMLSPEGRVKILDFGLAKLKNASSLTAREQLVGTLQYMAPEQAQGREVDHRADLYSIGCMAYEMATGRLPLQGDYPMAVLYAAVNEEPEPIERVNPEFPVALSRAIHRCLEKDPKQRFESALELKEALLGWAGQPHTRPAPEGTFPEAGNRPPEAPAGPQDEAVKESIEDLLQARQRIDELIASKFTRQITVMFSDVVGSTAFFERRGDLEGRAMIQRYNQLMFPVVQRFDGKIIKTIGDGILSYFEDSVAAARAACQMQRTLAQDNGRRLPEDRIQIRVALHMGTAVVDHNDVYGDVVNIAARLEKHAGPEQIVLSETLFEQLRGQPFTFVPVGHTALKGKEDSLYLYLLEWRKGRREPPAESLTGEPSPPSAPEVASDRPALEILQPYRLPEEAPAAAGEVVRGNPYMNRVKIQNPADFYGRRAEVKKIFSRIGAPRPQCVSIVGERRIGKSSLLQYLYHPSVRRKYLDDPERYIFLFVDFQAHRNVSTDRFFAVLLQALEKAFDGQLKVNVQPGYQGFREAVQNLEKHQYRLIFLFDEFELVTRNSQLNSAFYSYLRSLANNFNLAYIVASGRNLQTMCHSREISDSPFFNIFSNLTLSQFHRQDAVKLVVEPAARAGISFEKAVPFILQMAGHHPFYLQMACSALYEYLKDGAPLGASLLEKARQDFLDEARVHFQQLWESCEPDRQELLLLLAAGEPIPASRRFMVQELVRAGYVVVEKGKPRLFSTPMAEMILQAHGAKKGIRKKRKFLFWRF